MHKCSHVVLYVFVHTPIQFFVGEYNISLTACSHFVAYVWAPGTYIHI